MSKLQWKKTLFIISSVFFLLISFLFLNSDPDNFLALYSRDAFTDEGLNTSQIANFVKFGEFEIYETNNFLKTPLFNFWLLIAYTFFDVSIEVGRFWMLIGILLFLIYFYCLIKKQITFYLLVLFTGFFNYYLFQYAHFTMAEMFSVFSIFISLIHLVKFKINFTSKNYLLACLFAVMSILFKVQSIYFLPLFGILTVLLFITEKISWKFQVKTYFGMALFCFLAYTFWYLPHQAFFTLIFQDQMQHSFINPFENYGFIYDQIKNYFFNIHGINFLLFFLFSLILFVPNLKKIKADKFNYSLSIFLFLWILVESHKLFIAYLPPRYLVSTIFSIILFSSLQFCIAIYNTKKARSKFLVFLVFIIVTINFINIYSLINKRTYVISETNIFFKNQKNTFRPIVGQWANSLAINSDFKTISFTYNSKLDTNFFIKSNPKYLIIEKNENDFYYKKNKNKITQNKIKEKRVKIAKFDVLIIELK